MQEGELGPRGELPGDGFEAARHPHVVLVAQCDQVAGAGADRLLEIAHDAERFRVLQDDELETPGILLEVAVDLGAHRLDGLIGGGIIGQDELVRRDGLFQDAAHLLRNEGSAVVGAQRDGNRETVGGILHGRKSRHGEAGSRVTRTRIGYLWSRRDLPPSRRASRS